MLSYNELQYKQVVFCNCKESELKLEMENLCKIDKKYIQKTNLNNLFALFIIGDYTITSKLLEKLHKYKVAIIFMKPSLKATVRMIPNLTTDTQIRKKQYTQSEEDQLKIAQQLIWNKAENQIRLLKKENHDVEDMLIWQEKIKTTTHYRELLGVEGNLAKNFFERFYEPMGWTRREARTKPDIANLLLDIGYSFLFHFIDAIITVYGFDPYYGVYHKPFYQRKSLICDLVEPFRCIVDRQLLKSYNLGQIRESDFYVKKATGQWNIRADQVGKYCQIFSQAIMDYKQEIFNYLVLYHLAFENETKYLLPEFKMKR